MAPAELEGHLLLRPDVADACVVSILDDYSGELPLAYVVPNPTMKARIAGDPAEAKRFKSSLIKVRVQVNFCERCPESRSSI